MLKEGSCPVKATSSLVHGIAVCVLVIAGCNSNKKQNVIVAPPAAMEWRSRNFDVSATIKDGWQMSAVQSPGDTFDRPGSLLQAFVHPSGPYSYLIKVEKDVPLDVLPLEEYLDANRTQYTAHPANQIIDEGDVEFHKRRFYRFRFKSVGDKGPLALSVFIFRDGANLVSVQWTFPIETDAEMHVPEAISEFDQGVSFGILSDLNE